MPLLIFTWLVLSVSLHFTDTSALPSRSADLRGPPVDQTDFTMLAVQMREGRLVVSGEARPLRLPGEDGSTRGWRRASSWRSKVWEIMGER